MKKELKMSFWHFSQLCELIKSIFIHRYPFGHEYTHHRYRFKVAWLQNFIWEYIFITRHKHTVLLIWIVKFTIYLFHAHNSWKECLNWHSLWFIQYNCWPYEPFCKHWHCHMFLCKFLKCVLSKNECIKYASYLELWKRLTHGQHPQKNKCFWLS